MEGQISFGGEVTLKVAKRLWETEIKKRVFTRQR